MTDFLIDLMVNDQMWGSVVENPRTGSPICFGSGIFVSDNISKRLLNNELPFLLADLCQTPKLREEILTFKEVEESSDLKKLNFYGALFSFAFTTPAVFGYAMSHLQRSLVNSMSGFGINNYFKHCYGKNIIHMGVNNALMRIKFGTNIMTYNDRNSEIEKYHPILAYQDRNGALRRPGAPIHDVLCSGSPVLNLTPASRLLMKLEIEGYSKSAINQAIIQGDQDGNWKTVLNSIRKDDEISEYLGFNDADTGLRDSVREYIRSNPQELRVLPLLTPEEKVCWKKNRNLDATAQPNQRNAQKTRAA